MTRPGVSAFGLLTGAEICVALLPLRGGPSGCLRVGELNIGARFTHDNPLNEKLAKKIECAI